MWQIGFFEVSFIGSSRFVEFHNFNGSVYIYLFHRPEQYLLDIQFNPELKSNRYNW